jgi:hypothetical protein
MAVLFNYPALTLSLFGKVLGSVILVILVRFAIKLYQVRRNVRDIASKYGIVSEGPRLTCSMAESFINTS